MHVLIGGNLKNILRKYKRGHEMYFLFGESSKVLIVNWYYEINSVNGTRNYSFHTHLIP